MVLFSRKRHPAKIFQLRILWQNIPEDTEGEINQAGHFRRKNANAASRKLDGGADGGHCGQAWAWTPAAEGRGPSGGRPGR